MVFQGAYRKRFESNAEYRDSVWQIFCRDFFSRCIYDRSVAEAPELRGFHVKQAIVRFLPYSMPGGCNTLLIAVKAYLRMRFEWPLIGRQFLVIAQKP